MSAPIHARRRESNAAVEKVGDYCIAPAGTEMLIWLPHDTMAARIRLGEGKAHPRWLWDGNADSPTLTPSLHLPGVWHGYLTNGQLIPC